jgi:spermidine synthase
VWVPLYETNTETVKSEIATFMSVFPDGIVWGNTEGGQGYDIVLSGRVTPGPIDLDAIQARVEQPAYARVAQSLGEIGFASVADLFGTYAGRGSDLRPWLADAQLNRDRNLRLQYLAGLGLNFYDQDQIYQQMLSYRRWPDGLFSGSPRLLDPLRAMITGSP